MAAQKILSCYPDYGKLSPEYSVNLVDLLATYDEPMLVKLCDLRTGIVSKCKFPPVPADIVSFCESAERDELFKIDAAERDRDRKAVEAEEERRREWWKGREAKLAIARETYPDAFLLPDGIIARHVREEYVRGGPAPRVEHPSGGRVTGLKPLRQSHRAVEELMATLKDKP